MATFFDDLAKLLASTTMQLFFFFFLCFCLLPSGNAVYFNMPRFDPNSANILYQGDAVASVGKIELNIVDAYLCRVGWVTYAEEVRLWDSGTGKLSDFTSHYSFTIDTRGRSEYGHGIAFFLAPAGFQIPPNSVGGFLGLFNTTTTDSPHNQIVAVEFDSYPNPEWDPSYEHVGIISNSIASVITTPWNASFHSGDPADVWITYNATTQNLSVSWSYQATSNPLENSSLSYNIDLMKILPEWVTVGISAATGRIVERHTLESWEFHSSLEIENSSGSEKKIRLIVGLTVPIGILIAVMIIASVILFRRRSVRDAAETMNLTSINEDLERRAGPRRFSYKDLASATNNFSDKRKLGEGGFGGVYKGYLNDLDMAVAVKKISRGSRQGKMEYITEVKIISRLRHRNLVQLIGWCHDRGEFLLVYEFMPNGSLDYHLFGKRTPLTWLARYNIAIGLASGVLYLHEEWEQCVVHRDIKSSNVMLDSNFSVKLGDFGLARLMDHDHELGPQTTGLAGTLGYLAPEYISTGKASKESDVYSFGVVALEIATGRKSVDPMKKVEWVWDLYGRGNLLSAVDERLNLRHDVKQVECLMIVGLWCAHPNRNLRPTIRQAIHVLKFEAPLPDLPNQMPVPTYQVLIPVVGSADPSLTYTNFEVGR